MQKNNTKELVLDHSCCRDLEAWDLEDRHDIQYEKQPIRPLNTTVDDQIDCPDVDHDDIQS